MASPRRLAAPPEELRQADVVGWVSRQLNRQPDAIDLFEAGKRLLQDGVYAGAAKVLRAYVAAPGSEPPGRHLLGHACLMSGDFAGALEHLAAVVNDGFDSDWQALVEAAIEVDRRERHAAYDRILGIDEDRKRAARASTGD